MAVYREMEPKVDVPEENLKDAKKDSVYSIADIEKKLAAESNDSKD